MCLILKKSPPNEDFPFVLEDLSYELLATKSGNAIPETGMLLGKEEYSVLADAMERGVLSLINTLKPIGSKIAKLLQKELGMPVQDDEKSSFLSKHRRV